MLVLRPGQCEPPPNGSVVTIGAYDGVHTGHRRLLSRLRQDAAARGLESAVVTFDRHPASVVRPASAPLLLTDLDLKLELLRECGIDRTLVVPFDRDRANESAQDFAAEILVGALGARLVVVGEDFHFGHDRQGDVTLLSRLGAVEGFQVEGIALAGQDGRPVSSTRIRELVAHGRVAEAAELLGRPHQVRGEVVHGDGRGGSALGFPTANLAVPVGIAVPGVGIYAGRYRRPDGSSYTAAVSVGRRPTFYHPAPDGGGPPPLVEAYLVDFDGDLYGEQGRLEFVGHLRDEVRFERVEDLVAQMHRDVARARQVVEGSTGP